MKLPAFSAVGWFIAGGAVTLLACSATLIFIGGYTVGESACRPALSERS